MEHDQLSNIHLFEQDGEYENECGYFIIKALRGRSAGRILKRNLTKFSIVNFICGVAIFINSLQCQGSYNFRLHAGKSVYQTKLLRLMWADSILSLFSVAFGLLIVIYWSSFVTNRDLLVNIIRVYMLYSLMVVVVIVWMLAVLFRLYQFEDNWMARSGLRQVLGYLVTDILFSLPHALVSLLYVLDFSYYCNEIEMRGGLEADEGDPLAQDLSGYSLSRLACVVCVVPLVLALKLFDFLSMFYEALRSFLSYHSRLNSREREGQAEDEGGGGKCGGRRWRKRTARTLKRLFRRLSVCIRSLYHFILPLILPRFFFPLILSLILSRSLFSCCGVLPLILALPALLLPRARYSVRPDTSEEEEGDEEKGRGQISQDQEEGSHSLPLAPAPAPAPEPSAPPPPSPPPPPPPPVPTAPPPSKPSSPDDYEENFDYDFEGDGAKPPSDPAQQTLPESKDKERDRDADLSRMNGQLFKKQWGKLPTGGSFQCKLKIPPNCQTFIEHMRKQGFHVVFVNKKSSQESEGEFEVGISNIRTPGEAGSETPWFMARFVSSQLKLSAVVKCPNPAYLTTHVKKFALAKILKIDTSK